MKDRTITFKSKVTGWHTESLVYRRWTQLCYEGVQEVFPGLPDDVKKVTFVFSTSPHPEAVQLAYYMNQDLYDWYETMPMYQSFIEDDYTLHMDEVEAFLMPTADTKMRKLWEEGYNYMRCEYVA